MIQMEVEVCLLDDLPISKSKVYKRLKKLDPVAAKKTIYIKLVPDDDA